MKRNEKKERKIEIKKEDALSGGQTGQKGFRQVQESLFRPLGTYLAVWLGYLGLCGGLNHPRLPHSHV